MPEEFNPLSIEEYYGRITKEIHKDTGLELTSEQIRILFDWLELHNGDVSFLN
jgi:hypothetical protein